VGYFWALRVFRFCWCVVLIRRGVSCGRFGFWFSICFR